MSATASVLCCVNPCGRARAVRDGALSLTDTEESHMNVYICIGSSCYLKGSKDIITILERLIAIHNVKDKVTLMGSFCMGHCTEGVCVKIDDKLYSV